MLYYLSGLTCSDENAVIKSGFQQFAAKHGIAVVFPDTSARNLKIDGFNENWDFGEGAGFYLNATEEKWKANFNNYTYVNEELPNLIESMFNVSSKKSVMGHSMGGHGALILFLKNPSKFQSVSAFAPVANPLESPLGQKAFKGYLGSLEAGKEYDATALIKNY